MKIIQIKLAVTVLGIIGAIGYAYANCYVTNIYGCGLDSYNTGSCGTNGGSWVIAFTSSPDMDHCDYYYYEGNAGSVTCSNETPIQCALTVSNTDCAGNVTVSNDTAPMTPTTDSGATCY